ncbi:hypothetical protein ACLOJK_010413 [Asimina triloba]
MASASVQLIQPAVLRQHRDKRASPLLTRLEFVFAPMTCAAEAALSVRSNQKEGRVPKGLWPKTLLLFFMLSPSNEYKAMAANTSIGGAGAGGHPACASCRHQRKKCPENCVMAPLFPAEDDNRRFSSVQKVFGVSNMMKMIAKTDSMEDRQKIAESLVWDACNREDDPVAGSLGRYKKLMKENRSLLEENIKLKEKNRFLENQLLQCCCGEEKKLKEKKNSFFDNHLLQQYCENNAASSSGYRAWSNDEKSMVTGYKDGNIPLIPFSHVHQGSLSPISQAHYPPQGGLWADFEEQIDRTSMIMDEKTAYSNTSVVDNLSIDPCSLHPTALVGHMNPDPVAWQAKTVVGHLDSNPMPVGGAGAAGHPCSSMMMMMMMGHPTVDSPGHPYSDPLAAAPGAAARETKIHPKGRIRHQ